MTAVLFPRHRTDVLHARAISDDLIDAWPDRYRSFEEGDWETFARLMNFDLRNAKPRRVGGLKGMVTKSGGGVVITRYDETGEPVPPPYARADQEIITGGRERLDNEGNPTGMYRDEPSSTHYIYRPKWMYPNSKFIDVHPVRPEYRRAQRGAGGPIEFVEDIDVYFCLEGCFKADAILSAGMRDGEGYTTFSSTSVTTWNGKNLRRILSALREARTVYVVPDSDFMASDKFTFDDEPWFNPMVMYQTRLAAQTLVSRWKVNAKIAFPWAEETQDGTKLGVDDYLHLGYSVEDMRIENAYAKHEFIQPALKLPPSAERFLDHLMHTYGLRGAFLPGRLAKKLKMNPRTVYEAYMLLDHKGILKVRQGDPRPLGDGWINDPHSYVAFQIANGYTEWLREQPVPQKVKDKAAPWLRDTLAASTSTGSRA